MQLLAVRAFAGGLLPPPPGAEIDPVVLDVNRADVHQLQALPSIGPGRAEALILERIRNGPFHDLADLGRTRGFGPATCAGLAPFVRFGPDSGL